MNHNSGVAGPASDATAGAVPQWHAACQLPEAGYIRVATLAGCLVRWDREMRRAGASR